MSKFKFVEVARQKVDKYWLVYYGWEHDNIPQDFQILDEGGKALYVMDEVGCSPAEGYNQMQMIPIELVDPAKIVEYFEIQRRFEEDETLENEEIALDAQNALCNYIHCK